MLLHDTVPIHAREAASDASFGDETGAEFTLLSSLATCNFSEHLRQVSCKGKGEITASNLTLACAWYVLGKRICPGTLDAAITTRA
jgi:hypothetical protein